MTKIFKRFFAALMVIFIIFVGCPSINVGIAIADTQIGFTIYFIDVGQADSALVLCDQKTMLIDGGNVSDSDLIYTFLRKHGVKHLNYVIGTHAHEDHIGGLAGALNYATVDVAYSPVTSYNSRAFSNFVRYLEKHNVKITVPTIGDTFYLGSAKVQLLGPQRMYGNINNTSIVLKITYGETSFLFTGDAERESEADILAAGYDLFSTVLRVGHHGSDTSTTYPFLREIMPQYAVISVGKRNSYGHPDDNTLSRLRDADVLVYRTDIHGDITCTSDGSVVQIQTQKNVPPLFHDHVRHGAISREHEESTQENNQSTVNATNTPDAEVSYIGNTRSLVFHYSWCSAVVRMNTENRISFSGRDDAFAQSFRPCGICKP